MRATSRRMKKVVFAILFLATCVGFSQPAQVILIRHAEKPDDDDNIHLSAQGRLRARALPSLFTHATEFTTHGRPVALFAARPELRKSRRAMETLKPTAQRLHRVLQTPYYASNVSTLAATVLHGRAYRGRTVLIVWTQDYLPALAQELGVQDPPNWDSDVYDRAWVITYDENGEAQLRDLPQNLLPGDSTE